MGKDRQPSEPSLLTTPADFFAERVDEALSNRKIKTLPQVRNYLVDLLQFYVHTENLFDEIDEAGRRRQETLAERYLRANLSEKGVRLELLKRVGDASLYVSGFFGDSLKRKIVDIDYYAEVGGIAYANLANSTDNELSSRVFTEFSSRFLDFVDVLTYISQRSQVQTNADLLRLYDRYVSTGSSLAKEQLIEMGVLNFASMNKTSKQ